ncbi:Hemolysin [Vibrio nigripulchritudo MADA3029]|uniref:lysophospholipid acyltransferase family protein n=1 Tax=Vibrio nigripulchritudo TaxID=28173 RepID=UPI0003B21CF0|nr:GNAT family N-acyltransferase [Vibrio nigripulchritudo]CCN45160.1 Hemolysin [Vibrio nigripulchritudo MADA3020]CCN54498.1 Hemolysin [Vibrio nigripulchritudo MADA3021]CCN57548.1 Hemolysin [Vibrio nigripulchritudo MADA3029]
MTVGSPFKIPRKTPFGIGETVAEWATGLSQLDKFYAQRPVGSDTASFLRFTLETLGIDYHLAHGKLESVPKAGPTVVVANHPLGCVEGVILAELLLMIRPDVQILANQYLKTVPELDKLFIGVDVFETSQAYKANLKALRQAHRHLAEGGLLLVFPAGEVSRIEGKRAKAQLQDKEWSRSVSSLIKKNKATAVPCFIDGQNSRRFYMAGKIHPLLRTLMLGRELLNKRASKIGIRIGEPIKYKEVHSLCDSQLINYLRLNTYLLKPAEKKSSHSPTSGEHFIPVAKRLPLEELMEDLNGLPPEALMLESNQFSVYCCKAEAIPTFLHEIGRVREENFRDVGEGTGQALDLDKFDQEYLHLFIWDNDNQCLVGAYRLGVVDKLLEKKGLNALYSRTLFKYKRNFIQKMSQESKCIEMGRSVIAKDYQRSMSALLLLWKGIAQYIHRNPEYTHLFGPVSISNDYSEQARQLLADTMTLHHYDGERSHYVKATNPLRNDAKPWNPTLLASLGDLQLLSRVIARIDDGKTVPVLLRQYLGLNGKLVSFNVDPAFNNALDGLIVVDLRDVPVKTLARYMSVDNAEQYLKLHQCEF